MLQSLKNHPSNFGKFGTFLSKKTRGDSSPATLTATVPGRLPSRFRKPGCWHFLPFIAARTSTRSNTAWLRGALLGFGTPSRTRWCRIRTCRALNKVFRTRLGEEFIDTCVLQNFGCLEENLDELLRIYILSRFGQKRAFGLAPNLNPLFIHRIQQPQTKCPKTQSTLSIRPQAVVSGRRLVDRWRTRLKDLARRNKRDKEESELLPGSELIAESHGETEGRAIEWVLNDDTEER